MNKARVDVGQAPPLDLVSAQAEVAQRREQVISAAAVGAGPRGSAARADREAVTTGGLDDLRIDPTDRPTLGLPLPDIDAAVAEMLQERGDLQRARIEVGDRGHHRPVLPEPAPAGPAAGGELPRRGPRRRPAAPRRWVPGHRRRQRARQFRRHDGPGLGPRLPHVDARRDGQLPDRAVVRDGEPRAGAPRRAAVARTRRVARAPGRPRGAAGGAQHRQRHASASTRRARRANSRRSA